MEEEKIVSKRPYSVMLDDIVYIKREDVNWQGKELTFYKVQINKGKGNERETYYKPVKFRKGIEVENNAKIRIIDFFETCRHLDKYHDEFGLFISDFEYVSSESQTNQALEEYNNEINDSEYNEEDVIF